jgi:hypothetical protein
MPKMACRRFGTHGMQARWFRFPHSDRGLATALQASRLRRLPAVGDYYGFATCKSSGPGDCAALGVAFAGALLLGGISFHQATSFAAISDGQSSKGYARRTRGGGSAEYEADRLRWEEPPVGTKCPGGSVLTARQPKSEPLREGRAADWSSSDQPSAARLASSNWATDWAGRPASSATASVTIP